jgi:D-threo-aldose 1-dehydrogenase
MSEHYKPPVRFGLGGVPLGNEFAVITEKDAYATLDAAWSAGVRYYDTSPWHGLGLCERRFGNFIHTKDRSRLCPLVQSGQAAQGFAAE